MALVGTDRRGMGDRLVPLVVAGSPAPLAFSAHVATCAAGAGRSSANDARAGRLFASSLSRSANRARQCLADVVDAWQSTALTVAHRIARTIVQRSTHYVARA